MVSIFAGLVGGRVEETRAKLRIRIHHAPSANDRPRKFKAARAPATGATNGGIERSQARPGKR